jgi:hypothetical protein
MGSVGIIGGSFFSLLGLGIGAGVGAIGRALCRRPLRQWPQILAAAGVDEPLPHPIEQTLPALSARQAQSAAKSSNGSRLARLDPINKGGDRAWSGKRDDPEAQRNGGRCDQHIYGEPGGGSPSTDVQ